MYNAHIRGCASLAGGLPVMLSYGGFNVLIACALQVYAACEAQQRVHV